ncbi:unnamed protein product [Gongylonema pulchrum]|uniref:Histidine-rich glycoprotein-like n=1 Tax=Gongylonema pulchrum TaxID=637853 RepID=A0A183E461_9BILA|nr:unnamed protein product [Gongylonema pulchrum]
MAERKLHKLMIAAVVLLCFLVLDVGTMRIRRDDAETKGQENPAEHKEIQYNDTNDEEHATHSTDSDKDHKSDHHEKHHPEHSKEHDDKKEQDHSKDEHDKKKHDKDHSKEQHDKGTHCHFMKKSTARNIKAKEAMNTITNFTVIAIHISNTPARRITAKLTKNKTAKNPEVNF